jgi:hypothetical protein
MGDISLSFEDGDRNISTLETNLRKIDPNTINTVNFVGLLKTLETEFQNKDFLDAILTVANWYNDGANYKHWTDLVRHASGSTELKEDTRKYLAFLD